jgi:hypothetical protein
MFWKKKKKTEETTTAKDKLATGIASAFLRVQRGFASFMNRKTEKLTMKGQKVFLIGVCLLFGGLSLYTLIAGLTSKNGRSILQRPASIHVPKHFDRSGDEDSKSSIVITESEMDKIHRFERYMDSLSKTKNGKIIHDSILDTRPGLMDSIKMIETIYQSQKK